MKIVSSAFGDNQAMPAAYTSKGAGVHPPLTFSSVPPEAKTLALIMHDPDAPSGDFIHWAWWDLPASTLDVVDNTTTNATLGVNDFNKTGYGPPAPPSGTHHYIFDLYALDIPLNLPAGSPAQTVLAAIDGHVIATARLTGLVSA